MTKKKKKFRFFSLVVAGRGDLISENDILKALENGWIRGFISDVFETEPLPKTSQLWHTKNVKKKFENFLKIFNI